MQLMNECVFYEGLFIKQEKLEKLREEWSRSEPIPTMERQDEKGEGVYRHRRRTNTDADGSE